MPSRHHVAVKKSFENVQAGQRVALSPLGLASFRNPKRGSFKEHVEELAEEFEDGRIQLAGSKAPLDLEHSRTLLQRDGTLHDDYLERAKIEVFKTAKAKALDRQGTGPANTRA